MNTPVYFRHLPGSTGRFVVSRARRVAVGSLMPEELRSFSETLGANVRQIGAKRGRQITGKQPPPRKLERRNSKRRVSWVLISTDVQAYPNWLVQPRPYTAIPRFPGGPAIAPPPDSPATLNRLNRPTPRWHCPPSQQHPQGSNRPAVGQPNSPAMAKPHRILPYCNI